MSIEYNKKGLAIKVAFSWCMEDVIHCAKNHGKKISKVQASDVIGLMYKRYDCMYGMTWDVIWDLIQEVLNG